MVRSLCRYKDALGVPGRGAHAWRVGGVAAVDVILTVLAAAVIAWVADWVERPVNFWYVLGGLLIAGVVAHRLFCVRTAVDRWLFQG